MWICEEPTLRESVGPDRPIILDLIGRGGVPVAYQFTLLDRYVTKEVRVDRGAEFQYEITSIIPALCYAWKRGSVLPTSRTYVFDGIRIEYDPYRYVLQYHERVYIPDEAMIRDAVCKEISVEDDTIPVPRETFR